MSIFSKVKTPDIKRSRINLTHEVKTTSDFGKLTPFLCLEVLPKDTFQISSEIFARLDPMIAPIMHRIDVYTHYFYVPNRLIWDEFEDFMGAPNAGEPYDPEEPIVNINHPQISRTVALNNGFLDVGSLADYFGLPVRIPARVVGDVQVPEFTPLYPDDEFNALPFRAYQLIWNEWYRNENIQASIDFDKSSRNVDTVSSVTDIMTLRYRNWHKDRFTSALPWVQRGPSSMVPIPISDLSIQNAGGRGQTYTNAQNGAITALNGRIVDKNGLDVSIGNAESLSISDGTGSFSIQDLREANALQRWLERSARGGTRWIEQLLSHFGVKSSDARLDRPEYLGGGRAPISISEVLQNSQTTDSSPLGTLGGRGISGSAHGTKKYFCEEHGWIIGIMSIMPKSGYQQGMHRQWYKRDRFDYYWPEFQRLGEEPIYNFELRADANGKEVFGYTPRYSHYKYMPNITTGLFRSSLEFWHLNRVFANTPRLNEDFVSLNNPQREDLNRIFAVETDTEGKQIDHFELEIINHVVGKRPMGKNVNPGL